MTSKLLVLATAAGCITAAGVGSYLAVRTAPSGLAAPASVAGPAARGSEIPAATSNPPVDTTDLASEPNLLREPVAERVAPRPARRTGEPRGASSRQRAPVTSTAAPAPASAEPAPAARPFPDPAPADTAAAAAPVPAEPLPPTPAPETEVVEDVEVPAETVLGIRIETPVSSERSKVEDPVTARLTRDVTVDGRTVIPAGTEVVGYVSLVERGGRVKERARLGVRFTAVVLGDNVRTPIDTPSIFREGDLKTSEASAKIGASAVIGGILGGLVGGKRGAAIGGAAGAAGGTAVVMSGDRSEASLTAGTTLTLRLAEPLVLRVAQSPNLPRNP